MRHYLATELSALHTVLIIHENAVALPSTTAQVQSIVDICRRHHMPITARGRGTNTTGASVPVQAGLVVSFERMNRIIAIRPGDRAAIVEPGVLNGDLQKALEPYGLFWAPDPTSAPYSSIGGNIACNAGGPRAVKYGATRDNLLALELVTGTASLIQCGAAVSKNSSGFDMSRFIVGSEGVLGLITSATLKLTPLPGSRRSMRAIYSDVQSAADAVARIMGQPNTPSMLELMDSNCLSLIRQMGYNDLPEAAGALLMIEVDGDENTIVAASRALEHAARAQGLLDWKVATDAQQAVQLWSARKALSPALRTIAAGKINEDVVVPVSQIPQLAARVKDISESTDLRIVCFGHAGNGNLHVNILYDPHNPEESRRSELAMDELFSSVLALGGTLSGEHGIGIAKRPFVAQALSAETIQVMHGIKALFDPDKILNPGKLLP